MTGNGVRTVREQVIAPMVAIVDGIPGCGKTMVSAIISSFERVEIKKYNYSFEHVSAYVHLGKMQEDAAHAMICLLSDLDIYNLMMARETNFRYSDLSSVFRNPNPWRYFTRLFGDGDAAVMERIRSGCPILHWVTHSVLSLGTTTLGSLGDRVRIIECVRHPLYMLKQWRCYIERYGTDARDFTVWVEHKGRALPWFAHGWEDEYSDANMMDRCILSIDHLLTLSDDVLERASAQERERVLHIPFEQFVLKPAPFVEKLQSFLGTKESFRTAREMRHQKVPRTMLAEGLDIASYRTAGWEPAQSDSEKDEFDKRREFAAAEASHDGMAVLERLCREYEEKYMKGVVIR